MDKASMVNLSDAIFGDIENNEYLNELYNNILYNYALKTLCLDKLKKMRGVNVTAALRRPTLQIYASGTSRCA